MKNQKKKKVTTTTTTVVVTEEVVAAPAVTRVALVIDRSGSMLNVRQETWNGINRQIDTLKAEADKGGETFVSYIQFDDIIETVFENVPAKELKNIPFDKYEPRGWTALYDATLRAIATLQKTDDPENTGYLVVVVTDGQDNRSRETNQYALSKLIKEKEATGKWTFTYMLSNIDARQFAQALNINWGNVSTYTSDKKGMYTANLSMSESLGSYMKTRSRGATSTKGFYTDTPADDPKVTPTPPVDPDKK